MPQSPLISDTEFTIRFKNKSLDPSYFDHKGHIRLGYLCIKQYGPDVAQKNLTQQIPAYANHLGEPSKYHETLTIASIKTINHFIEKATATTFGAFILEFPQLINNFKGLIEQHYSNDILWSSKAKKEFIKSLIG